MAEGRDAYELLLLERAERLVSVIERAERLVADYPLHPAGRMIERTYELLAETYADLARHEASDVASGFLARADRRWA
jgi:hypothetical protein